VSPGACSFMTLGSLRGNRSDLSERVHTFFLGSSGHSFEFDSRFPRGNRSDLSEGFVPFPGVVWSLVTSPPGFACPGVMCF